MHISEFILMSLKTIQRGTVDRKSSFRLPVLSTSLNDKVFQRIVVARNFDPHDHSLLIFTDRESHKYYQLQILSLLSKCHTKAVIELIAQSKWLYIYQLR